MQSIKFKIQGITPLMMHNDRYVNSLDPGAKALKALTSKRTKSDDDHLEIGRLSWAGALYYKKDFGLYIPGYAVIACLKEAAKLQKKGKDLIRSVTIKEVECKLNTAADKLSVDEMFGDGNTEFIDKRTVVVSKARVMRWRPIFKDWSTEFTILFNEQMFNKDDIINIAKDAGQFMGLLEMRPIFGKFEILD